MDAPQLKRALYLLLAVLVPVAWLSMRYAPYNIDGDAVSYMDLADLIHAHRWAGVVNAYWHPLYPATLALAQAVLHPARTRELPAYYAVNYVIFLLEAAAMLGFVSALDRLRAARGMAMPLLSGDALRVLGVALVVIASQRELGLDKVRPDALLETLMLAAFACLLRSLARAGWWWAPLAGLFFGLAYLTKSFALVVTLFSLLVLFGFAWLVERRGLVRAAVPAVLAGVVFAAVAGPYVAALSRQKGRLDFGDSGALNAAWFTAGTEKLHLQPGEDARYGKATVVLKHPERQVMRSPGVFSYKAEPYGTYPDWFDPTYFNDRITPHLNLPVLFHRDLRNAALVVRYGLNHPEAPVLLALLLALGARIRRRGAGWFWLPMVLVGLAMWGLYGLVNIEERYVTLAYLVVLLPVFALLARPREESSLGRTAAALTVLLLALVLGESLRTALEARRLASGSGRPGAWYAPQIFGTADALGALGVRPGDEVACLETIACVNDPYWARLAGVRVTTEVYNSGGHNLLAELEGLHNRPELYAALRGEGAKALVAWFAPGTMVPSAPAAEGWVRLGDTDYWALPLNLPAPPPAASVPAPRPWSAVDMGP